MTRAIVLALILCCISKDTICKSAYRRITTTRFDQIPYDFFYGQSQSTAFKTGLRIQDKSYSRNQPHHHVEYSKEAVITRPTAGFDKMFGGTFDEFNVRLRDMRDQAHRKRTRRTSSPELLKAENIYFSFILQEIDCI